jgi:hypothetical protein
MHEQNLFQRYREGIVIGLLVCAVWGMMAWLFHAGNSWARPVFYGATISILVLIAYFNLVLVRRIPKPKMIVTSDNIEGCIRKWLDNHKVMVKVDPESTCYFRYRITLDVSGIQLTILRSKIDQQEYVKIFSDLGLKGEEGKKILALYTDQEKSQLMFDIKTEMARARVGYSGLVDPPENFLLFQRVPIYPSLTEYGFMSMVFNVEAATSLVTLMFLKSRIGKDVALTNDSPRLPS